MKPNNKILLNEILKLDDLNNVKIRFNLMFKGNWNPIDFFKNADTDTLLEGQYWNYKKNKSYKKGQITIGFIRLNDNNLWLLFHVGRVTRDLNKVHGVGYECEVVQVLPDTFDNDIFPGYDKVRVSWEELSRVITKEGWKTALQNQKGVYLITDISNGKMYVGSAYGENMILGRWRSYVRTGHGGNVELKKINFEHIKKNFEYSILDIFKSTTDDQTILTRENWWKSVLKTREFGYNKN